MRISFKRTFSKVIKCPECSNEITSEFEYCKFCGFPLENKNITNDKLKNLLIDKIALVKNITHPNNKRNIIIGLLIIVLLVIVIYSYNNILWGNDKIAYNILVECSRKINNPSEIKIIDGCLWYDFRGITAKISNKNDAYGKTTEKFYDFSINGNVWLIWGDELELVNKIKNSENRFNVYKVNRKFINYVKSLKL